MVWLLKKVIYMKKEKIIILILILLLIIELGLLIGMYFKNNNKYVKRESKEEYYETLETKLESYFKLFYKQTSLDSIKTSNKSIVFLEDLEEFQYPLEDIVSYNKEKCDKKLTYVIREKIDTEYVYKVNYKCGEDTNYDYQNVNLSVIK